ncbi:hypothetical protein ABZ614_07135 [Streptomyces sp. NPDC013178]|uniref:hypothetical protein n=1 Tax=Streptomyces sp. NPDC013178 TaxID=3155118 RepID=UPI0034052643
MLLLAGCASTGGKGTPEASATASPTPITKASPVGEKTVEQVLGDIRYASKDIGDDRVSPVTLPGQEAAKVPPCQAHGVVLTREVPNHDELVLFTDRLQKRGWKLDGAIKVIDPIMLSSGKWDILLNAAPIPQGFAAKVDPNKGGISVAATGVCKKV